MLKTEPRATAARYDRTTVRVVVDLVNGCTYAFPAQLVQDLQGTGEADLSRIEDDGVGFNLHWPALDVDLYAGAGVGHLLHARLDGASPRARGGNGGRAGDGRSSAVQWCKWPTAAQYGVGPIAAGGTRQASLRPPGSRA